MRIYLSSFFEDVLGKSMKREEAEFLLKDAYVLASFAYAKPHHEQYYSCCKDLLVDSGAFTIMVPRIRGNKPSTFDARSYCKKYAEFVKKNKIDKFIELDIEGVVGFDVYRDCLHELQDITGKDPIYVFHKWRGLDYFKELVKQKDYVCLGDVDVATRNKAQELYFSWFVDYAHQNNCKVHGLAFTQIDELTHIPFDSVDSSSWTVGIRYASVSRFNGHDVLKYDCKRTATRRLVHDSIVKRHDFLEWKKLQQYFDTEYEPIW